MCQSSGRQRAEVREGRACSVCLQQGLRGRACFRAPFILLFIAPLSRNFLKCFHYGEVNVLGFQCKATLQRRLPFATPHSPPSPPSHTPPTVLFVLLGLSQSPTQPPPQPRPSRSPTKTCHIPKQFYHSFKRICAILSHSHAGSNTMSQNILDQNAIESHH